MNNVNFPRKYFHFQYFFEKVYRKLEKPLDFDPFGHAGLSPLATI